MEVPPFRKGPPPGNGGACCALLFVEDGEGGAVVCLLLFGLGGACEGPCAAWCCGCRGSVGRLRVSSTGEDALDVLAVVAVFRLDLLLFDLPVATDGDDGVTCSASLTA